MVHRAVRAFVVAAFVLQLVPVAAQQPAVERWYGRLGAKSKDFEPLTSYPGSFQIELPKEWQLVPGHSGTVFTIAEKTKKPRLGAAITLEHMQLQAPVDPSIFPALAAELLKDVQSRDSSGTGFNQQVINADGRSLILIQYDRPGLSTGQDHVVQYSLPQGTTMYHLICIAPRDEIDKYRGIFAYTAASFVPVKSGS